MKLTLSACAKFFCAQAVVFTVASIFAVEINAQQATQIKPKPQAILFAEWSQPDQNLTGEAFPARLLAPAKTAANTNYKLAAVSTVAPTITVHSKSAARFAHLQPSDLEQKAFDLINQQRRLQNLPALEWDLGMLAIAREHSASMAQHKFFSHAGVDGKTADDRAEAAGIKDWNRIGENIAFNDGIKAEDKVDFAVKCWLRSVLHKENLLGEKWTRSGIGVAVTPEGKFYITQVFRN